MTSPGHSFAEGAAAAHELVHGCSPQPALQDMYLAALAWESLFILEFSPSPHLSHSACRKPNFGKCKTTEMSRGGREADLCTQTNREGRINLDAAVLDSIKHSQQENLHEFMHVSR